MPRPIRAQPYNPALAEYQRQQKEAVEAKRKDRRSTDLLRNAQVAPMEVDNPDAIEPGDKIVTLRSTRCDPLAAMHARKGIDDASYHGGRAYQHDFETAERGPQAIDPTKEHVDGGKPAEPITDQQQKAVQRLAKADRKLGEAGSSLIRDFLIEGLSMDQISRRRDLAGIREKLYVGRRIKECLEELAFVYGLTNEDKIKPKIMWRPSIFVPDIGFVYLTEDDILHICQQDAKRKAEKSHEHGSKAFRRPQ